MEHICKKKIATLTIFNNVFNLTAAGRTHVELMFESLWNSSEHRRCDTDDSVGHGFRHITIVETCGHAPAFGHRGMVRSQ